ncbi:nucleotidyltransferase family protein [Marisediminicola senii]|uniref:nucleotidyltransferase family protein n=1 Tax=Marisediminicola senii TaxID=2711233 RepID=UPI0013EAFA4D|nr:NTP transferase domain-containing protein [Marisediminicola senii]
MPATTPTPVIGILLAAGAGRRMGMPKALVRGADGVPWVERGVRRLLEGGCRRVVVVLGAEASTARGLVPDDPRVTAVVAADWQSGMAASIAAGLSAAADATVDAAAAVITLVDLPSLPTAAVRRVIGERGIPHATPNDDTLRQAVYSGTPGHPVLVGRSHWAAIAREVRGDAGARPYLVDHGVAEVECGDLWNGHDVDEPHG